MISINDPRVDTPGLPMLNQLLSELDGFGPRVGIVFLAATNRPEVHDAALMRDREAIAANDFAPLKRDQRPAPVSVTD